MDWLPRWYNFSVDRSFIRTWNLRVKLPFAEIVSQDQWCSAYQVKVNMRSTDISNKLYLTLHEGAVSNSNNGLLHEALKFVSPKLSFLVILTRANFFFLGTKVQLTRGGRRIKREGGAKKEERPLSMLNHRTWNQSSMALALSVCTEVLGPPYGLGLSRTGSLFPDFKKTWKVLKKSLKDSSKFIPQSIQVPEIQGKKKLCKLSTSGHPCKWRGAHEESVHSISENLF